MDGEYLRGARKKVLPSGKGLKGGAGIQKYLRGLLSYFVV